MAFASAACLLLHLAAAASEEPTNLDELVDYINSAQSSWVAARSPAAEARLAQLRASRNIITSSTRLKTIEHDAEFIQSLPDSFHPKDKWPNCSSLDEIRDQGACGSCWAHGAAEAMTDRYCTYGADSPVHVSAEDLLTCCLLCGTCNGGSPDSAWLFWQEIGIVTGGNYLSNEGCKPYSIRNCSHHTHDKDPCKDAETPVCVAKCREGYSGSYNEDKRYGSNVYAIKGEQQYMAEMFKNGPVEVTFTVYEDFFLYKSGVYQHVKGKEVSFHAVKALGWGEQGGLKYWLIANSWNAHWGEKGFFKILRGSNHCKIEERATAGDPQLN